MSHAETVSEQGSPIPAMSWLDWSRRGNEYVGGRYRVRLIEPYRWEVVHDGEHLFFDASLKSALIRTDDHHRERLRRRDLFTWGALTAGSASAAAIIELLGGFEPLWSILLLWIIVYLCVSGIVRFFAAAGRHPTHPYRRRAPRKSRRR